MKTNFKTAILLFTGFALLLLTARLMRSGSFTYLFMIWNLFLAYIPWSISDQLKQKPSPPKLLFLLCAWLLFIPNAPYMLTDLFHLRMQPGVPLWMDLILISSFALIGLMIFFCSFRDVLQVFGNSLSELQKRVLVPVVFWLVAFGTYLGRYGRFNSWDVVSHPFRLARRSAGIFLSKDALAFTFVFSIFLWLVYLTLSNFSAGSKKDA